MLLGPFLCAVGGYGYQGGVLVAVIDAASGGGSSYVDGINMACCKQAVIYIGRCVT